MLEQKIDELISALNANTAAHSSAPSAEESPAKVEKPKVEAPKVEKPKPATTKKEMKLETVRVASETFLGIDNETEYALRRSKIKEYLKSLGIAKLAETPADKMQAVFDWIAKTTAEREAAAADTTEENSDEGEV